jgi:hypothetical protein
MGHGAWGIGRVRVPHFSENRYTHFEVKLEINQRGDGITHSLRFAHYSLPIANYASTRHDMIRCQKTAIVKFSFCFDQAEKLKPNYCYFNNLITFWQS